MPLRILLAVVLCCLAPSSGVGAEVLRAGQLSVDLPESWKTIMGPVESQGLSTVIFSHGSGTAIVGFVSGPNGGADAKTIAGIFASQFHAEKPPVADNGRYSFTFQRQQTPGHAWVAVQGNLFMVTLLSGDRKIGQSFVRRHVRAGEFADLLPR